MKQTFDQELVCEVLRLTLRCQSSSPTEDDCAQLNVLLMKNPEARKIYLLACSDTANLINSASSAEPTVCSPSLLKSGSKRLFALALACGFLFAMLGWMKPLSIGQEGPSTSEGTIASGPVSIGQVVSLLNVKWSAGAAEYREWSRLDVGDSIQIEAGVVELMLDNSTEIKLEGPADFCLQSLSKAVLSNGNLVARCGPEAVGFKVVSPDVNVVDLGTEFGVSVRSGQHTDVVVYDGEVDLTSREGKAPLDRRLTAGEALHIPNVGSSTRITEVRSDRYLTPAYPLDRGVGQSELIRSVGDNLHASETAKYYRVVSGGFAEDCRAFVDRPYEWNGVDERGLPEELLGGDYIMSFNDDKIRKVEIEVDLAQPSVLYVLFDDRVPTPDWLSSDFIDTGMDVGMDEANATRRIKRTVTLVTGVGPGDSIDHVFSVWKKESLVAGKVRLGTIREQHVEVIPDSIYESMYGVVVTKLAQSTREEVPF